MKGLVLSLFPGIGLLDMAFEEAGFVVVRGPDLLWGGDVRSFHAPPGRFDGIIGGPPCKRFSPLANIVRARWGEGSLAPDLIPEFCRIVGEARPRWWVMENVERAPLPVVAGYAAHSQILNNRHCGGIQQRRRRITFGTPDALPLYVARLPEPSEYRHAVTTNSGGRRKVPVRLSNGRIVGNQGGSDDARLAFRPIEDVARDQELPEGWIATLRQHGAFTMRALRTGIGNGVPLPMGRAIAAAVASAIAGVAVAA